MAEQLTARKTASALPLFSWMRRAIRSLPVPVSPWMTTLHGLAVFWSMTARRSSLARSSAMAGLLQTAGVVFSICLPPPWIQGTTADGPIFRLKCQRVPPPLSQHSLYDPHTQKSPPFGCGFLWQGRQEFRLAAPNARLRWTGQRRSEDLHSGGAPLTRPGRGAWRRLLPVRFLP